MFKDMPQNTFLDLRTCQYEDRLEKLNLSTLDCRMLWGDMIEIFTIHKVNDNSVTPNLIINYALTTGHSLKLFVDTSDKSIKKYSFNQWTSKPWNNHTQHMIEATSVFSFANRLDKLWNNQPLTYSTRASPLGSDQQIIEERTVNRFEHRG